MIRPVLTALAVAVAAVGLSLLLVPGGEELALMYMKDRRFDEAERAYRSELSRRGMQRQLVVPLNELRLQAGRIDEAIGLMERYAGDNPGDVEVHAVLADYYRQAQRPREQVEALARLAALQPRPERLRELAQWYDVQQRPDDRRALLRRLADGGDATPDELEVLARLDAAAGDLDAAATTLARLWRGKPKAFAPTALMLYAAVLADSGRAPAVRELAAQWSARGRDPTLVLELARTLESRGQAALGLVVLDTVPVEVRENIDTVALYSGLQIQVGHGAAAMQGLLERDRTRPLPDEVRIQLIEAALAAGDEATALNQAGRVAIDKLPQWMLPGLIEAGLRAQRPEAARRLFSSLNDGVMAARPMFAAKTALALGDAQAARRWATIAERTAADDSARAELALFYRALGDHARARQLLLALSLDSLPAGLRTDAVNLYLALGEARRGVEQLENSGDLYSDGWALLSTASGRERQVLEWLPGYAGRRADKQLIGDLYALAEDQGLLRLRAALAERGVSAFDSALWRLRLAFTRLEQQRPLDALALIRPLRGDLAEAAELYPQVLLAAVRREPAAVSAELDTFVRERIARDGVSAPGTGQLAHDLLDAGALRTALPLLAALANTVGGDWFESYAQTLARLGDHDTLAAALQRRLADATLAREERAALLLRLARAGATDAALDDLEQRVLAEREPAQYWLYAYEDAARQLGREARLNGFLERAAFAPDTPRAALDARAWMLLSRIAPARATPVLARLAARAPGTWDAAYRENLLALGRDDELARHLMARARGAPPAARREAAFALLDMRRKNDALVLFEGLAAAAGPDSDDVRQLLYLWGPRPGSPALDWLTARVEAGSGATRAAWARHLVALGAPARAASLLASAASAGDDPDADAVYLEALIANNDRDAVRAHLGRLLDRAHNVETLRRVAVLATEHDHPQAAHAAWARILELAPDDAPALRAVGLTSYELGQWARAARHLERLLHVARGDFEVEYFLAESLVALGQAARAAPHFEAAARLVDADPRADFRMRTVRAQSLHRLGHTPAAAVAYEKLLAERPAARHLRADYGDMLIESGNLKRAATVLR